TGLGRVVRYPRCFYPSQGKEVQSPCAEMNGSPNITRTAPPNFESTLWSVVVAAADSAAPGGREAMEELCRTYWHPIYAFVRRQGNGPDAALDLTQEFFARFL